MKAAIINGKQKYFFFGGKDGVDKTTMAASSAIHFAKAGYKTLIVSTDPTVSLSAIYQQEISEIEPTEINGIQNLHALNINPKSAAGPFQKRLSNTVTQFTNLFGKETINTPCMEEMAVFDQFVRFLNDDAHDIVVLIQRRQDTHFANLGTLSINVSKMIVNEIIPYEVLHGNWFLKRRRETQDRYLAIIKERFNGRAMFQVPLFETNIVGIESLKNIERTLYGN